MYIREDTLLRVSSNAPYCYVYQLTLLPLRVTNGQTCYELSLIHFVDELSFRVFKKSLFSFKLHIELRQQYLIRTTSNSKPVVRFDSNDICI